VNSTIAGLKVQPRVALLAHMGPWHWPRGVATDATLLVSGDKPRSKAKLNAP